MQGDASSPVHMKLSREDVVSGTITTQNLVSAGVATAGSAVEFTVGEADTLCIQVTGVYTGALSIQATVNGTTWVTLSGASLVLNAATSAFSATIASAAQGIFQVAVNSFLKVRVTALAAVTGTATITLSGVQGNSMVALDTALPAGAAVIGAVTISGTPAVTATGTPATGTTYNAVTTASTNAASVKNSAGSLYGLTITNPTATPTFVKLYNKASAPTVGTDIPVMTIPVAANTLVNLDLGAIGKRFATGIAIAATAAIAATDTGNAVAGVQINGTYI